MSKKGAQPWGKMLLSGLNTLKIYMIHACEAILSRGNIFCSHELFTLGVVVVLISCVRWLQVWANECNSVSSNVNQSRLSVVTHDDLAGNCVGNLKLHSLWLGNCIQANADNKKDHYFLGEMCVMTDGRYVLQNSSYSVNSYVVSFLCIMH